MHKSTFPASSVILFILVIGHSFDCLLLSKHAGGINNRMNSQLWAGHQGHRGDLDTGEFLLLQQGVRGKEKGEYTLKDSARNTPCDKGKAQGMGDGVGSPQRWPVQPEARHRLPEKSAPEGQSGGKEKASQRERASAGLSGTRRLRLCPLTEQMWRSLLLRLFLWISLAPLFWFKGTPWSHPHHPPKFLP